MVKTINHPLIQKLDDGEQKKAKEDIENIIAGLRSNETTRRAEADRYAGQITDLLAAFDTGATTVMKEALAKVKNERDFYPR